MSGEPEVRKKVTPRNLAAALALVFAVQVVALWITVLNKPVYDAVGQISVGPFTGSAPTVSIGNALTLVVLVFATTLGLVWLIRKKLVRSFKAVVFLAVAFSAFALTWFTIDGIFSNYSWYGASYVLPLELAIAAVPAVVIGYTIFFHNYWILSTTILGLISAEVGSFFASTLPLDMALFLPLLFGIYDIYAVFRGPLKQLVSAAPAGALAGMSVKTGEFTLGLGDIVFYSMLPSIALFYLRPLNTVLTLVAVDFGVVFTLYLLTRRRLLPGLPIPMALGLLVLAISFL
ncbi:MAG TPA: hypothetical protein VLY21_04595 [Nitrososphaerales archaeon]|nr:hypothetical protein [Nitrososphaerales archaeon]